MQVGNDLQGSCKHSLGVSTLLAAYASDRMQYNAADERRWLMVWKHV
jgi:hypothetical protein